MLKYQRKKCTEKVVGKIIKIQNNGLNSPTVIHVQYLFQGQEYILKETLKMRTERFCIGFIVLKETKIPKIGIRRVGEHINIFVNPNKPSKAYIEGNIGIMTN